MVETTELRQTLMSFYTSVFGWTWDEGTEETGFYSIASSDGSPVMGVGQGPGGQGHLVPYFATSDIAASTTKAAELGATVLMGPMQVMEVGSMSLIMDPAGAVHGLWQPNQFQGFGVVYEPNTPGWFDHVSKNPDGAAEYYGALTGQGVMTPEPGMKILHAGEQWFASISPDPDDQPPHWSPIFVVDSLDRIHGVVRGLGATLVVEKMPVPGSEISVFIEPVLNTPVTVMAAGQQP